MQNTWLKTYAHGKAARNNLRVKDFNKKKIEIHT